MNCRDFFESNKDNEEFCRALQLCTLEVQLEWECQSASPHSPGPVADDELLCRQVVDPTHYDRVSGTIKPTFFDDASSKGASIHRWSHTTAEKIQQISEARVSQANANPRSTGLRESIGYATVTAADVRGVLTQQPQEPFRRGLGIYDTGKAVDNSHGDICQLVSGRQQGSSVRAQLFKIGKSRLVRFP